MTYQRRYPWQFQTASADDRAYERRRSARDRADQADGGVLGNGLAEALTARARAGVVDPGPGSVEAYALGYLCGLLASLDAEVYLAAIDSVREATPPAV